MRRPLLVLDTPKEFEDFFKLLGCRVKITEYDDVEPFPKLVIRVPYENYHFLRWFFNFSISMRFLYEVKVLDFFECRKNKYQFNFKERT